MNRPEIRKGTVLPFLMAAAVVLAGVLLASPSGRDASAAGTSMIGIDVQPETNTPSSLGTLESCVSHDQGDEFPVDVFVNNVTELRSWELRIDYDESVLQLVSVDHARFLVSTPPEGSLLPALSEWEAPGRQFLAAAELSGAADTGSGVLAQLTFKALDDGESDIAIVDSPSYFRPELKATAGLALGDSNGDNRWDDTITKGKVVVGKNCSGGTVITPKPSPKPTPTLPPGATPRPTPTQRISASGTAAPGQTGAATPTPGQGPNGGGGGPTGGVDATPPVVIVITDGPTRDPDDPAPTGNDPSDGDDDDSGDPATGRGSTGGGDDGASAALLIIGVLVAAALVAGGGVLYMFSRRAAI